MDALMEEKCHICGEMAEFYCHDCDQPVCENCCVMSTYMNQIECSLCIECGDVRETGAMEEREREWKRETEVKAKKEKRAATRKANYWKPKNVAKRKAKKAAMLVARKEANEKRMIQAVKAVASMFRGVF